MAGHIWPVYLRFQRYISQPYDPRRWHAEPRILFQPNRLPRQRFDEPLVLEFPCLPRPSFVEPRGRILPEPFIGQHGPEHAIDLRSSGVFCAQFFVRTVLRSYLAPLGKEYRLRSNLFLFAVRLPGKKEVAPSISALHFSTTVV